MRIRLPKFAAAPVYNCFVHAVRPTNNPWLDDHWKRWWNSACRHFAGPVQTVIHGRRVTVNFGYTYPVTTRKFTSYNLPLVELVNQAYIALKRPINVVDVGAAVGDTVLLLSSNCGERVSHFLCIDGDPEFFGYLQENVGQDANVTACMALLSSSEKTEKNLVRTPAGGASAQGSEEIRATTLDTVVAERGKRPVHVLKIDVDGFDGRVLRGAPRLLHADRPAVIFEWHPILCRQTGNNHDDHFEMLLEHGYTRFLWFTKFGDFSHFTDGEERVSRALMAELCFRGKHSKDWHYDVVALHDTSNIDPLTLAEMPSRKLRKSRW